MGWFYLILGIRLLRYAGPWILGFGVAALAACLFRLPPLLAVVVTVVLGGYIALQIERFLRNFSGSHRDPEDYGHAPRRNDRGRRRDGGR